MKKSIAALGLLILTLTPNAFAQYADTIVGGSITVPNDIPANTYFQHGKIVSVSELEKDALWCDVGEGVEPKGTYDLVGFQTFSRFYLSNQLGNLDVTFTGSNTNDGHVQVGFECWQSTRPFLKVVDPREVQEALGSYVQIKTQAAEQNDTSSWLPLNLKSFTLTLDNSLSPGCIYFKSGAILPNTKCNAFAKGDGIVPYEDYVAIHNTEGRLYTIEANKPQQVESVNIRTNFDHDHPNLRCLALYFEFQNSDFELMALAPLKANKLFSLQDIKSYLGPHAHIELH